MQDINCVFVCLYIIRQQHKLYNRFKSAIFDHQCFYFMLFSIMSVDIIIIYIIQGVTENHILLNKALFSSCFCSFELVLALFCYCQLSLAVLSSLELFAALLSSFLLFLALTSEKRAQKSRKEF